MDFFLSLMLIDIEITNKCFLYDNSLTRKLFLSETVVSIAYCGPT